MSLVKRVVFFGGALAVVVGGCNRIDSEAINVDGYMFDVPKKHLIQEGIPWLPVSQSEILKFIVNPEDRPQEQIIVTIESISRTCNPKTEPVSDQLSSICSAASRDSPNEDLEQNVTLEKIIGLESNTQWIYPPKIKGIV